MMINTDTIEYEVKDIEDLKNCTARTRLSDEIAKNEGYPKEKCAIWNGCLFYYKTDNTVIVKDYYGKKKQTLKF